MESFPCIICGKTLDRVFDEYESQPSDGVMCTTTGNYGSTVFDTITGDELLHFNICDPCLIEAGKKGHVFHRRVASLISTEYAGIVGSMPIDRPFTLWDGESSDDDPEQIITLSIEEIEKYQDRLNLNLTIEQIKLFEKEEAV